VYKLRVVTDLEECEQLWRKVIPEDTITDLWEVRECFDRHFSRPPHFFVAENECVCGLVPTSWIEEYQRYVLFPGEIVGGYTWLEQNRVFARDGDILQAMLEFCPAAYDLSGLLPDCIPEHRRVVDEMSYLFRPRHYGWDLENYFQEFSHRNAKKIKRQIADLESRGVRYRYDDMGDYDLLVQMSISRFGETSYFADPRFREALRSLAVFLRERGWLRMTTVLIEGEVAAVDIGCVYRNVYTLLGGGTNSGFPGVAKLINLHHMRRACEWGVELADFLCGDFSWKTLFHLTPRPLYELSNAPSITPQHEGQAVRSAACVEGTTS